MHVRLALIGVVAAGAACGATVRRADPPVVRPGIDVLLADSAHWVRGLRVGLVTNQAGVDRAGRHDVERLRDAGVRLVALFSPEHGFRGSAAPGAAVAHGLDSATGLPIYSLYGPTSAPSDSMVAGLDLLLVDLQDAGARYYTYISTTVEVMRVAARHGLPVVVLDRPNPIGGLVQGNVLDSDALSFVGRLRVPMRHGLTLGELARLANQDLALGADLRVVPVAGWRRQPFDSTGLPFIPPSPNLPTLESLYHYPGLCLFEGTNLSVGRGSDAPFEQIGAPWLDPAALLVALDARRLPGVSFRAVVFRPVRPGDGKYADTVLAGIRLTVTDRDRYDPTATAVHLLAAVRAVHGDRFRWLPAHFDRLMGQAGFRAALDAGQPAESLMATWGPAREVFRQRVTPWLLYGPEAAATEGP